MRSLFLILFLPILAMADTTIVITTDIFDTEIREQTAYVNYGAATSMTLDSAVGNEDRGVLWIDNLDTFTILQDMTLLACTLVLVEAGLGATGNVSFYLINTDYDLQEGTHVSSDHQFDGGMTWYAYKLPTIDDDDLTISYPHSFIQDTLTAIRNQGRVGSCGFFAAARAMESRWMRDNQHHLGDFNTGDGTGLDRTDPPCSQGEDDWAILCQPSDGHDKDYKLYLDNSTLQTGDDLSLLVYFFHGEEGALVIDNSEIEVKVGYTDMDDEPKPELYYTFGFNGGGMDITVLYDQELDSVWDASTEDTIPLNADYPVMLLRIDDFKDSLETTTTFKFFENQCWVILQADTVTDACSLAVCGCQKNLWSNPNWSYWDSDNSYNWADSGAEYTVIDLAEQQLLSCGGQASAPTTYQFAQDSIVAHERDNPYEQGAGACYHATDSALQIEYWYRVPNTTWDTVLAVLYEIGPLAAEGNWPDAIFDYSWQDSCFHWTADDTVGHAMALTGWDSSYCNNELCLRFDNSWGINWGQDGWGYFTETAAELAELSFYVPLLTVPDDDTVKYWDDDGCDGAADRDTDPFATVYHLFSEDTVKVPLVNTDVKDRVLNGGHLAVLIVCQTPAALGGLRTTESVTPPELRITGHWPVSKFGKGKYGKGKYGM